MASRRGKTYLQPPADYTGSGHQLNTHMGGGGVGFSERRCKISAGGGRSQYGRTSNSSDPRTTRKKNQLSAASLPNTSTMHAIQKNIHKANCNKKIRGVRSPRGHAANSSGPRTVSPLIESLPARPTVGLSLNSPVLNS